MAKPNITRERALELLHYDPETGVLTWLPGAKKNGRIAGGPNDEGYIGLMADWKVYRAHRLIWLMVYGYFPSCGIDHINGIRTDNRLSNLRLATPSENAQNMRKATSQSAHGWLGVTYEKQKRRWRARIRVNGIKLSLGMYSTPEEAHAAYIEAKRKLHTFCTI